jgi:hypothetical protein
MYEFTTLPTGKWSEEWAKWKVGNSFRNMFGRNVKLDRILLCDDGRVIGFYSGNGHGAQLLNKDVWRASNGQKS